MQPTQKSRASVFLSHNTADKPAVEEIAYRLKDAGVDPWFDKWKLIPGERWQDSLERALRECTACAVFIGPSGFGKWQNEEMRAAIDRRVNSSDGEFRVIPVLLPGARREERSKLPSFLVSATWVEFAGTLDDETAFLRLIAGIRGEEPGAASTAAVTIEGSPYRGLDFFDVADHTFFFGREALTGWLLDALRPGASPGEGNRFLAVVGPSGSGKSSLARAGLMAALKAGELPVSAEWPQVIFRPGSDPIESLLLALGPLSGTARSPASLRTEIRDFVESDRTLHQYARMSLRQQDPARRLCLLVDQFEEVFTQCRDTATRKAFIENLVTAATLPDGQTIVVVTIRADLYGQCAAYPALAAAVSDHQMLVGPLQDHELRRAIERPANLAGAEFERGLVDTLVNEVRGETAALPLLQYTLLELWNRRDGRRLTHAAYQEIGRVEGALEQRAEQIYDQFSESDQKIVRNVLLRLTQSTGDGPAVRRGRIRIDELVTAGANIESVERVIGVLAGPRVRLLSVDSSDSERYVEIAHEALIRSWPRLRGWVERDQEFQLWQKRLTASRIEWERTARHPGSLLRGALLDEARRWLDRRGADLNTEERDFIAASAYVADLEIEEERERQRALEQEQKRRFEAEQERARSEARSARLFRKLAIGLAALLVATVAFGAVALLRGRESSSRALASASIGVAASDSTRALELALEAIEKRATPEAGQALEFAVQQSKGSRFMGHDREITSVAVSPDGQTLVTTSEDGTARQWRVDTGDERPEPLFKSDRGIAAAAFSPDGARVAIAGNDGVLRVVARDSGAVAFSTPPIDQPFSSATFSPDGKQIATGTFTREAIVWNALSGAQIRRLPGHAGPVRAAAYSPDGKRIGTASTDKTARVWDSDSGAMLNTLPHPDVVTSIAFSRSGDIVATGSDDGNIRLWRGTTVAAILRHGRAGVSAIAFDQSGQLLASAGLEGSVKVWDTAKRSEVMVLRGAQNEARTCVSFVPGSYVRVIAGSKLATGRLYELDLGRLRQIAAEWIKKQ